MSQISTQTMLSKMPPALGINCRTPNYMRQVWSQPRQNRDDSTAKTAPKLAKDMTNKKARATWSYWSGGANQDNFYFCTNSDMNFAIFYLTHQGSAAMGSMHHSLAITHNKNLRWPGIAQVLSSHCLDYKFLQKWEFCKNLRSDDFYWDQEQVSALITSAVSDQLWQ